MHSLGQNIAVERERQRASLMEWGHGVLVDLHRDLNAPRFFDELAANIDVDRVRLNGGGGAQSAFK